MRAILVFLLIFAVGLTSQSEVPANGSTPKTDVYFLVDASGTMQDEKAEATQKLNAMITLLEPAATVSMTYFGRPQARNSDPVTCADDVPIELPALAELTELEFPALGRTTDKTSIGKALYAALNKGGADAYVVLITDGVEECNSDFVSIRRQFPNATIDVVQVGDRPNSALDLLEIKPTDVLPAQSLPIPFPVQIYETQSEPITRVGFLEKWLWLIGFIGISLNAMVLGLRRAGKSVELERSVKKFERLQQAVQNGHDDGAKDLLNQHIEDVDGIITNERKHYRFWPIVGRYTLAAIAFGALLLLATLSPVENPRGFDLMAAQNSAWTVLNSDFATAFAVTWIALLFFYGSQSQRRREALKDLEIATESASRFINGKRFREFETYETKRAIVRTILTAFKDHSEHLVYTNGDDLSVDLNSEYDLVLQTMELEALGKALERSQSDDGDKRIADEIRKLKILIEGSGLMFSQEATLPRFIERLIETQKIVEDLILWRAYASAVKSNNSEQIRLCLQNLTAKLRST
jgi:hypothetical protein